MYRVYCNGQEFGIDYRSLAEAQAAKRQYQSDFPHLNYYIRFSRRPRISQFVAR